MDATVLRRLVIGGIAAIAAVAIALALAGGGGDGRDFDYRDPFDRFPKGGPTGTARELEQAPAAKRRLAARLRFVSADVQAFWAQQFERAGASYAPSRVVAFEDVTRSGCGLATAEVGPFYCVFDETVYLDLDFFRALEVEFRAPGDFAQAYVLAHEIGHHVQNVSGIFEQVYRAIAQRRAPWQLRPLSIRLELQADCLAGVWGHSTYERGIADNGDLDEALRAAAAVGDDRIQKQLTGRIEPERWTHGSSAQRRHWVLRGFTTGDPNACDTFSAAGT